MSWPSNGTAPPVREQRGYQRAPNLRIIVACGMAGVLLAGFAAFIDFGTDQNPAVPTVPGLPSSQPAALPSDVPTSSTVLP